MVSKKRAEPEAVEPVVIGARRYEVVPSGRARGMKQDGGVIRAVDVTSGDELWYLEVYRVTFDPNVETDKQEIYIARLTPTTDGGSLLVETERGRRYRVDLRTRAVTDEPKTGAP